MDYTLYQLLWFFLIYAFLGWLMETALAAVRKRRLLNRGFLNAPFSRSMDWPPSSLPFSCRNCAPPPSFCSWAA